MKLTNFKWYRNWLGGVGTMELALSNKRKTNRVAKGT